MDLYHTHNIEMQENGHTLMITVEAVKTDGQREQLEHILREHVNGQLYIHI